MKKIMVIGFLLFFIFSAHADMHGYPSNLSLVPTVAMNTGNIEKPTGIGSIQLESSDYLLMETGDKTLME